MYQFHQLYLKTKDFCFSLLGCVVFSHIKALLNETNGTVEHGQLSATGAVTFINGLAFIGVYFTRKSYRLSGNTTTKPSPTNLCKRSWRDCQCFTAFQQDFGEAEQGMEASWGSFCRFPRHFLTSAKLPTELTTAMLFTTEKCSTPQPVSWPELDWRNEALQTDQASLLPTQCRWWEEKMYCSQK